ncbi:unnamed protein product [Amoebophrya sp. A25]|nr:unnamed protein product [Amoebophrya sp. A25]|eukprot:GSA25T00023797001.1
MAETKPKKCCCFLLRKGASSGVPGAANGTSDCHDLHAHQQKIEQQHQSSRQLQQKKASSSCLRRSTKSNRAGKKSIRTSLRLRQEQNDGRRTSGNRPRGGRNDAEVENIMEDSLALAKRQVRRANGQETSSGDDTDASSPVLNLPRYSRGGDDFSGPLLRNTTTSSSNGYHGRGGARGSSGGGGRVGGGDRETNPATDICGRHQENILALASRSRCAVRSLRENWATQIFLARTSHGGEEKLSFSLGFSLHEPRNQRYIEQWRHSANRVQEHVIQEAEAHDMFNATNMDDDDVTTVSSEGTTESMTEDHEDGELFISLKKNKPTPNYKMLGGGQGPNTNAKPPTTASLSCFLVLRIDEKRFALISWTPVQSPFEEQQQITHPRIHHIVTQLLHHISDSTTRTPHGCAGALPSSVLEQQVQKPGSNGHQQNTSDSSEARSSESDEQQTSTGGRGSRRRSKDRRQDRDSQIRRRSRKSSILAVDPVIPIDRNCCFADDLADTLTEIIDFVQEEQREKRERRAANIRAGDRPRRGDDATTGRRVKAKLSRSTHDKKSSDVLSIIPTSSTGTTTYNDKKMSNNGTLTTTSTPSSSKTTKSLVSTASLSTTTAGGGSSSSTATSKHKNKSITGGRGTNLVCASSSGESTSESDGKKRSCKRSSRSSQLSASSLASSGIFGLV